MRRQSRRGFAKLITTGNRKFFTGTRNKGETLRIAQRLEDEQRQIRLGYRPALQSTARHGNLTFAELKEKYLAWGESQGGRGGRPWRKTHVRNRITHLGWWQERLGLEMLADLEGFLPRVPEWKKP